MTVAVPQKHKKTKLTIITEAVLERHIVHLAEQAGVRSWTIADVRSVQWEGARGGEWEPERTIKLEFICEPDAADQLAAQVLATYADDYSLAATFADVYVMRPSRY